nr:hypothetical protein CCACVL1_09462 [Ipomoea batatas]
MLDDLGRGNTEFFGQFNDQNEGVDAPRGNPTSPNKEAAKFYRLLIELEQELYPGCEESSTLSFIVELLNWKCLYGISANVVDGVLQIMKNGFLKLTVRWLGRGGGWQRQLGGGWEGQRWLGGEAVAVRGGVGEGRARLGGVAVGGAAAAEEERRWRSMNYIMKGSQIATNQLLHLAYGPDRRIYRYKSILINGWRFNTKDRDLQLKSQNSGILVKGDADTGNLDYFGVLTDIIQLNYQGGNNVILFKANWWDVYHKTGFKVDKFGFPMVNITRKLQTDEPYVLASQAEQVYYVSDIKEPNWHVVVKTKPRDFYDLPDDVVEDEPCQENENFGFTIQGSNLEDDNNVTVLHRPDLDATTVEVSSSNINTMSIEEDETDSDGDAFINDDAEIPTTEDEEADDD